jgi:uncharacterized FlgJ-related protein
LSTAPPKHAAAKTAKIHLILKKKDKRQYQPFYQARRKKAATARNQDVIRNTVSVSNKGSLAVRNASVIPHAPIVTHPCTSKTVSSKSNNLYSSQQK